jgi:hypothetical protein
MMAGGNLMVVVIALTERAQLSSRACIGEILVGERGQTRNHYEDRNTKSMNSFYPF